MAELIIASDRHSGFEQFDIIKVYMNGYYRHWKKLGIKKYCFVVRLPLLRTRKIKRRLNTFSDKKRAIRVKATVNPKGKECVTKLLGFWIETK